MEVPFDKNRITYFASADARNKRTPFGIKADDRTRHVYIIGKTGMGKSTLLENMAIQDIQNGEGLAFIDPHGKTAELLLDYIPENRIKDVLYFAPFDMEYPIAFNVMEDIGPDKRHLVVSGLMSAFKKIWVDAWSARMEYILQNTLLALLEYPGSTLLFINKMLSDKIFRKKVVDNIADPTVRSFWVDEFAKYTERFAAEATPAIQNKVGQFTSNSLIRNIIGQTQSTFNLRKMMDDRKILIINLSKGLVGESNANLLGSMLITKMYLAAMSRADVPQSVMAKLPNFYLYVDEFQSFANESFADILSEARKYKLNLTLAHQYLEQMSEEVRAAVIGNVGTMISFRVGAFDAETLEKEFAPQFTAEDMVNLGQYQLYLKLMIDGVSSAPFSATGMPPIPKPAISYKEAVLANSRLTYGKPRSVVEADIEKQFTSEGAAPVATPSTDVAKSPARVVNVVQSLSPEREKELKKLLSPEKSSGVETNTPRPPLSGLRSVLTSALKEKEEPRPPIKEPDRKNDEMQPARPAPRPSQPVGKSIPKSASPFGREAAPRPNNSRPQKNIPPKWESKQNLKDALSKLLAQEKESGSSETDVPPQGAATSMSPQQTNPREIPKDELKKMFEVPRE